MSGTFESPVGLSMEKLSEIAKWHRYLVWMVFLQIVGTIPMVFAPVIIRSSGDVRTAIVVLGSLILLVLLLATGILSIYGVYKLAAALSREGIVYAILMLVPYASLIVLLHLSAVATHTLRANGINVGIMGASREELERVGTPGAGPDGPQGI